MRRCAIVCGVGLFLTIALAAASVSSSDDSGRQVVNRIEPVYPELAKKMNLSGSVKVRVLVTREGDIRSAEPLGGSPVFIDAVLDAIEKWKFAPAAKENTVVLKFTFVNQQ